MGDAFMGVTACEEQDKLHPRSDSSSFDVNSSVVKRVGILQEEGFHSGVERRRVDRRRKRALRVMKFGGTSVGNAACMERAAQIIQNASRDSNVVVVVSAMSGVTDSLIKVATLLEAGDRERAAIILEQLRNQHNVVANMLIKAPEEKIRTARKIQEIFNEGDHLCQSVILGGELTLEARDSIASLGERLSAPLLAAALEDQGVASEAIDATELVVTDSYHGASEPLMELTQERCEARLRPLLNKRIVAVVTGYIGATPEGVLTTLGRGGSDYSATILGAALHADEVIIWTDVDGILTADPRLVPGACTIPEISYREAADLAYFGAKVLHPKTLRPLLQSDIPVWIRNTFAPERPGTKISSRGSQNSGRVKALTAMGDVAFITVGGPGIVGVHDVLGRTFMTTEAVRADVLLVSQSSSQNDICFVVPSPVAQRTVEALRTEFAPDLAHHKVEHITVDQSAAIVAVVGEKMNGTPGIVGQTFAALGRENVNIIAIAQGSAQCNISFLVAKKDMKRALDTAHREFQLGPREAAGLTAP
ncbi:MAG: aspartate kinase [Candidatus Acidiferrum sp.]|jgi:aspartokinase/homoserine dehydrogenase 1